MKDEHNDLSPFKCDHEGCNFECKNPGILTNHSKIHRLYRKDLIILTFRVGTGRTVTAVKYGLARWAALSFSLARITLIRGFLRPLPSAFSEIKSKNIVCDIIVGTQKIKLYVQIECHLGYLRMLI